MTLCSLCRNTDTARESFENLCDLEGLLLAYIKRAVPRLTLLSAAMYPNQHEKSHGFPVMSLAYNLCKSSGIYITTYQARFTTVIHTPNLARGREILYSSLRNVDVPGVFIWRLDPFFGGKDSRCWGFGSMGGTAAQEQQPSNKFDTRNGSLSTQEQRLLVTCTINYCNNDRQKTS